MKKVIKIDQANIQSAKNAILLNTFDNAKSTLLKTINQDYTANIFEHIPRTSTFSKHLKQQPDQSEQQQIERKEIHQIDKNSRKQVNLPQCNPNIEWPLFVISTDHTLKRFWNQRTQQDQRKQWQFQEYLFQGMMLRIGRKKKNSKGYYYKLSYSGLLMYFKKVQTTIFQESDALPKGYLELSYNNRVVFTHYKTRRNEVLPLLHIERTEGVGISIFDPQNDQTIAFGEALSHFCLMRGFDNVYTELEQLGSGAFATVFKTKRKRDDTIFAAKTIYQDVFEQNKHKEKFIQMVYNEVVALKSLDHVGIEKIYEIYQEKDKLVIMIEYCGGGNLYQYYKQKGKINEKNVAQIMRGIVEALLEMHCNGFVHRDIKLENIMISHQDLQIKLVDFGFAEKINEKELLNKSGTPGFIPPEIFRNQPYTAKGDIFSAGIILYILASGQAPFRGRPSQIQMLNSKCLINFEKHPWPELSFDLRVLSKKMLEIKPQDRYSTVEVLESAFIQHHTKLTSETNYKSFQMLSGLELEKNNKCSARCSIKNSESGGSRTSKEFQLDFSIHTNDIKSLYQKNSLKTVQSQRSKKQSLNKSQKLKISEQEADIIKYQDKRKQSHPEKSSCHDSQLLNSSFGELIKQRSSKIIMATFTDTQSVNQEQRKFLKQYGNVFNQPKKPKI